VIQYRESITLPSNGETMKNLTASEMDNVVRFVTAPVDPDNIINWNVYKHTSS
jgi:uncharacterized membrane-anchored protein